jgi:hypothetical protein
MAQFAEMSKTGADETTVPQNRPRLVCLLEDRLRGYQLLAESLEVWRRAFVENDLQQLMQQVDAQFSCCSWIAAAEDSLRKYAQRNLLTPADWSLGFPPEEARQVKHLVAETASLRAAVAQLNRVNARIVEKAALRNAILRNLYGNTLVYGDPRAFSRGPQRWLEE